MTPPAPAWKVTLSSDPIVAAIQTVAVLTHPDPSKSQRAVRILHSWHLAEARAAGLAREHPGASPARIEARLQATFVLMHRRFEAARWALMILTKDGPISIRFHGAPKASVRALARWLDRGAESNVIRGVWTASKPVLALALGVRSQFEDTPTLEQLCFSSAWVRPAIEAAECIAVSLDASPAIEYRAADRISCTVPDLISA